MGKTDTHLLQLTQSIDDKPQTKVISYVNITYLMLYNNPIKVDYVLYKKYPTVPHYFLM